MRKIDAFHADRSSTRGRAANMLRGFFVLLVVAGAPARADAKEMRRLGAITVKDGVIHDALAFDENGGKLAFVYTDGRGLTHLRVGPPLGQMGSANITTFSPAPERVLPGGGNWLVIANDGSRRGLIVDGSGRLRNQIGPFTDAFFSTAKGKSFVTVIDKGDKPNGHAYGIAAYRPDGSMMGQKQVVIASDGTIANAEGLSFVAFTNGYLQALVKTPGRYNRKSDARGGTEIAVFDVLSWKAGPSKKLPDIVGMMRFAEKRNERPGQEAFVRLDDTGAGLELVGPGEKVRPLGLPMKLPSYDERSLDQRFDGGKLVFGLIVDPAAFGKSGPRALHVFDVNLGSGRADLMGEVPLGDTQSFAWTAAGGKVALLKKTLGSGGTEIAIYGR